MVESGRLDEAAVMRAALTLSQKQLVRILERTRLIVTLTPEGREYASAQVPERRLIEAVKSLGGNCLADEAASRADLSPEKFKIALGWCRKKNWLKISKDQNKIRLVMEPEADTGDDEKFLKHLAIKEPVELELSDQAVERIVPDLKNRGLIESNLRTDRILEMTEQGWAQVRTGLAITKEVSSLTPELIATGSWRQTRLRKYDIKAPVSRIWPGKKQPYNRFLEELRQKLVTLGFKEMTGPTVEFMFFNCDTLYMPQDHPAREIFDIYMVKEPSKGTLDKYETYLENVKQTHENGWKSGSTGWGYQFSKEESRRLVLRSHGTALSARTLISKNLEIPGKYFSVVRCYRPELVDRTHLTEFNQVEGIVVGEDLNLRDLLGVLEKFAIEIAGADRVRYRPDYFPFTEPSVELAAYKEGFGWIEFGGSGIFRPELTRPLGIQVPVIAWGLGVDRLFMMKAGIEDIRDLFTQNLGWIRKQAML